MTKRPRQARTHQPPPASISAGTPRPPGATGVLASPVWRGWGVALALALLTLAVYAPVRHHGFISLDDTVYVTENPHVVGGLTAPDVWWAFTGFSAQAPTWHPVTWLSHMLDVQVLGLDAGRHHLVSALLHAANTVLLFFLLQAMTTRTWPSAMVAALFGVHPLHVESVAWIAERKDVLSTLFWLLTTLAYVRSVRRPGRGRHAAVVVLYAFGLMAKPMLVTLPVTLLLLDWWPLNRLDGASRADDDRVRGRWRRWIPLVVEKWPLFLLAAASSAITVAAQRRGGAVAAFETIPFAARLANACLSCVAYVRQTFWPSGLSLYYPHPGAAVPAGAALGALIAMCGLCGLAWRQARSRPHLVVGLAWFLVTLAPVIGLVQVGFQARADRYTYVPVIGLFVAVVWECALVVGDGARRRGVAAVIAAVVVASLGVVARAQVERWSDESSLWTQALAENGDNFYAHYSLGRIRLRSGQAAEALPLLERAVALAPWFAGAHDARGMALSRMGRIDAAIQAHQQALQLEPASVEARANLGLALEEQGRVAQAVSVYREALRLDPGRATLHASLGHALGAQGDLEGAVAEMREAIRLQPRAALTRAYLARFLAQKGQQDEAVLELGRAIDIDPDLEEARALLGTLLAESGRADEAITHLSATVRLRPDSVASRKALGAALAGAGRLDDAIAEYRQAARLAPADGDVRDQLGLCLVRANRLPEAVTEMTEAVRLRPQLGSAHVRLGMALAAAGDLDGGAAHLREALRLDPANRDAQAGLAAIAGATRARR
jgi:protein O-mannosyl-transferase